MCVSLSLSLYIYIYIIIKTSFESNTYIVIVCLDKSQGSTNCCTIIRVLRNTHNQIFPVRMRRMTYAAGLGRGLAVAHHVHLGRRGNNSYIYIYMNTHVYIYIYIYIYFYLFLFSLSGEADKKMVCCTTRGASLV